MRLSLKTKFTLATSLLVLAVVTTVSGLYIARLTRQTLREADDRSHFVAKQIYLACQNSMTDAAARGESPASSSPADLRAYVQRALDNSSTLNSVMESAIGYSPTIYEITISDLDGIVLVSSDASLRGQKIAQRPPVDSLERGGFFQQLRTLYGPPLVYEDSLPFNINGPFGDIRIGLSSVLIRNEISPGLESAGYYALASVLLSTLLALIVSRASLAPIDRISAQLDRISAGEFDLEPVERGDEFGAVSTKIIGIGKQLRDVREIFSTLRENLDQVMGGLEDGLLLFNARGNAVLVSPSVEKFLGQRSEVLRGLRVSEIFPPGHPAREALGIHGDEVGHIENAEITLEGLHGSQRIGLSAQVIREHGLAMGALITLRDVEALEPEPQQAVKMLDSEIDRLDRAVKTFLNFTKPLEIKLEETDLRILLDDVLEAARPTIAKAGIELRVDLPAEFPHVLVDGQLIHQAVLNLLLNASDFTSPGGSISLSLSRHGDFAVIAVADSGTGISPENQKKIFQLFFTTRPGGTGIGLANTFRFVQLHNGRIECESEPGRGTTFRLELPLARSLEAATGKHRDFGQPFAEEKR